jgi:predicted Zn finger-like uncharacterized protein
LLPDWPNAHGIIARTMSLATRCPACGTVFRVVQDQLRVSEGWVRCGQCQDVFNALETLFDLAPLAVSGEATEPPPAPAPTPSRPAAGRPVPAPQPAAAAATSGFVAAAAAPPPAFAPTQPAGEPEATVSVDELNDWTEGPRPEDHWNPDEATVPMGLDALAAGYRAREALGAEWPSPSPAQAAATAPPSDTPASAGAPAALPSTLIHGGGLRVPHKTMAHTDGPDDADARADDTDDGEQDAPTPSRFIGPVPGWARSSAQERRSKKAGRRVAAADASHAQPHVSDNARRRRRKPEFVRQAERAALWRRPMVRAVLGSAAALLAAMLAAQVAYQYREPLAARSPLLAPALHAGCAWLGCRIGAPLALDRIRLEASDLSRTNDDQVLRFTADLYNTADFAVRAPALDLSFTDASGQVVSRKVLMPSELGARGEALGAEGQWRVDARLAVGDLRIAGYTVEVFYP